jgi:hypothetical protein
VPSFVLLWVPQWQVALLMEYLQVETFEVCHKLEVKEYYNLTPKEDKTKLTTTNPFLQKS